MNSQLDEIEQWLDDCYSDIDNKHNLPYLDLIRHYAKRIKENVLRKEKEAYERGKKEGQLDRYDEVILEEIKKEAYDLGVKDGIRKASSICGGFNNNEIVHSHAVYCKECLDFESNLAWNACLDEALTRLEDIMSSIKIEIESRKGHPNIGKIGCLNRIEKVASDLELLRRNG